MKNLAVLFSLVFVLSLWSCGGGSGKEQASEKPKKETKKKLSLKTQEGMMAKLDEFGIKVPAPLTFLEISRKSGEYTAKFNAENVDEAARQKLDAWYQEQLEFFKTNGWSEMEMLRRENEVMVGLVHNVYYFKKPRGGGSTLSDIVSLASVYDPKKLEYKLYVSPSKH